MWCRRAGFLPRLPAGFATWTGGSAASVAAVGAGSAWEGEESTAAGAGWLAFSVTAIETYRLRKAHRSAKQAMIGLVK